MQNLLWIDLEMTGLDVEKEVIIEVAAIVTDSRFEDFAQYHAIVHQPQHYLDNMDEWNTEHHTQSGLIEQIPNGESPQKVEMDLLNFCKKHLGAKDYILAGNSISQDRLFLNKYFTRFSELLHYRMLDVSSWKIVFNSHFDQKYEKANTHRALDDIKESIAELKFYMSFIK